MPQWLEQHLVYIIDLVRESSSETQSSPRTKRKVAKAGRNGGVIYAFNGAYRYTRLLEKWAHSKTQP